MDIVRPETFLPSTVKPKPIDKVLIEALGRNIRVDGIKVKIYRGIGIFEQTWCKDICLFYLTVLWG